MTRSDCDSEMLAGYWDGLHSAPGEAEPGDNRSYSYRHGWRNGRDDRMRTPRARASYIRDEADKARLADLMS